MGLLRRGLLRRDEDEHRRDTGHELPASGKLVATLGSKVASSSPEQTIRRRGIESASKGETLSEDPATQNGQGEKLARELARDPSRLPQLRARGRAAVERLQQDGSGNRDPLDFAILLLVADQPSESFEAVTQSLGRSSLSEIERALESIEALAAAARDLRAWNGVRRLLALGLAARFRSEPALQRIRALGHGSPSLSLPVVLITGASDALHDPAIDHVLPLLLQALERFEGTVISGGTHRGVDKLAADLGAAHAGRIRSVVYVPDSPPPRSQLQREPCDRELRRCEGADVSPLEWLYVWADLLASGIRPDQVPVVAVDADPTAAAACRIALALGATVGFVVPGERAGPLPGDPAWSGIEGLLPLPTDASTLAAFLCPTHRELALDCREAIARGLHESYRASGVRDLPADDPSLADWDDLAEVLRESNRNNACHILEKLERIGCRVEVLGEDEAPDFAFTSREVELLSEIEHGRWNVERLRAGWRWGPERDSSRSVSPYLVAWSALSDDIRDYDRRTVREIPALLARVGLVARRSRA